MSISTEKKVGLFFLLALIALGVMIELVEEWDPFATHVEYKAYFDSAVGINEGDPVRLAGVEVGKVSGISLEKLRVRVDFYVAEGTRVKEDTVASIRQTNLLGGQFLGLTFGSEEAADLPPGSAVPAEETTNIDQLITRLDRNQEKVFGTVGELLEENRKLFNDSISQVESILRKIDRGEGTLGKLVNDPALYDELAGAVSNLDGVLEQLREGDGTFGRLLRDPQMYEEFAALVADLRVITRRVRDGEGTVGRLFVEEDLYLNARDALAEVRDIAHKANSGTGTVGMLVNDDALYEEARGALERINSIAAKIDRGDGTLGRLVNEDDLYRDARTTLHKVEKTVDGLSDSGPLSALGVVLGTLF